ncbi:UDP-N-acetylmuramoyl-L-alanine--D-glutamate ligase [uncultured Gimesia sp.]|uniref:UDP-N-acetylmuramoyl-L-alanine--D-glutamate ligase n=1 Tax=uncultured Gimesia sp. TaxID=1678688 RepID=UPI00262936B4|nr:UDP-N-acetylmuramoyl-L-alanine--D-glutamate ligase [uncultured Gimesia sp.]
MPLKPFRLQNFDFKGSRATVLGLGRFGGSIAVIKYLADRDADITVIDNKSEEDLVESLSKLASYPDIKFELGSSGTHLPETDFLVANPAIPPHHGLLKSALEQHIPVTSEIELFWQLNRGKVIGVTGSNGKSTTTAMIHSIIELSGARSWLGGNIGISLLPVIDQIQPEDWVILELSSFQLEALNRIQVSPQIAVVTNFSPNHLDWHQTVEHYSHSKQTICRWQTENDFAVINADDLELASWNISGRLSTFGANRSVNPDVLADHRDFEIKGQEHALQPQMNVPGIHNRLNAAAAISACLSACIDLTTIQKGLEKFQGLPHRLQFVGEFQNRRFYNDSLATTPESTICALDAFENAPIILMAGGSDKKIDLTQFARLLHERTKATALMGETGPIIANILEKQKVDSNENGSAMISQPHTTFEEAFDWAYLQSDPGDLILLSPGCASYDWFSSFVERGEQFINLFRSLSDGINHLAQK